VKGRQSIIVLHPLEKLIQMFDVIHVIVKIKCVKICLMNEVTKIE